MDVVQRIYDGKIPDTKPPVKKKLADFVEAIRLLRERAEQVRITLVFRQIFTLISLLALLSERPYTEVGSNDRI